MTGKQTRTGILVVNGESGDDLFNVNYEADGLTQTFENGIGETLTDTFSATAPDVYELSRKIASDQFVFVTVDFAACVDSTIRIVSTSPTARASWSAKSEPRVGTIVSARADMNGNATTSSMKSFLMDSVRAFLEWGSPTASRGARFQDP